MLTEVSLTHSNKNTPTLTDAKALLARCGFNYQSQVCLESKSFVRVNAYPASAEKLKRAMEYLQKHPLAGWKIGCRGLQDKDWLTKWQRVYDISAMGQEFCVVPLWKKDKYRGKKIPVWMDPQGSFGSGTHATTQLVIQAMEKIVRPFESFLDVGTGTGVLLIPAFWLGAKHIVGVDHDARALATAKLNLKLNEIRGVKLLKADAVSLSRLGAFDVVAANLLSKTLVDSAAMLSARVKKGGTLIVSGIEKNNLSWFLKNFKAPALKRVKTTVLKNWCSVLYHK